MQRSLFACGVLALTALIGVGSAQEVPSEGGEWRYLGGDAGNTRSAPLLTQINASNFADLEVAWIWRGSNFGAGIEYTARATPVFVTGRCTRSAANGARSCRLTPRRAKRCGPSGSPRP